MLHATSSTSAPRWLAGLTALVVWMAAAAVVAYWTLQFAGVSGPASLAPMVARPTAAEPAAADVQKALGEAAGATVVAETDAGARFGLSGVVAWHAGQGAALISVDAQAPKAFKVGQTVAEGLLLQSLTPRQARLAATLQGPTLITLEMPALAFAKPDPPTVDKEAAAKP